MCIISIDASTTMIGYSIWNDESLIDYGKISPSKRGLEWRERIQNFIPQLQTIIDKYEPKEMYIEDVPLISKKGKMTLVQLGATQGSLIGLCGANNIKMNFVPVSSWRKNIGLYNGTEEGKERDSLKIASIDKANDLFNLNLQKIFTKNGTFKSSFSDDDISDSILLYASTIEKYKVKKKQFGRR